MPLNVNSVNVFISGTANVLGAVGTVFVPAFVTPSKANGGGVTITRVDYHSGAAIAIGSCPAFQIVYATAATPATIVGTVATNGSVAYGAGTPVAGSIATSAYIPEDSIVFVRWAQTVANADKPAVNAMIQYVLGK